jgi:hypothetical protein
MRNHGMSPVVGRVSSVPLPDADHVATAWADTSSAGVIPLSPDKAKSVSVAMLFLGVVLLWLVPLGGAFLLSTAGLGLTIFWEPQPGDPRPRRRSPRVPRPPLAGP